MEDVNPVLGEQGAVIVIDVNAMGGGGGAFQHAQVREMPHGGFAVRLEGIDDFMSAFGNVDMRANATLLSLADDLLQKTRTAQVGRVGV